MGRRRVFQTGSSLTHVLPFSYNFREDGSLTGLRDQGVLEAAIAQNAAPLLVITNFRNRKFDSDLAATLLRNKELQDKMITNMLAVIKEKGYRGVNFDFEYVYPADRENYNEFLRRVVERFRPEGYLVSTALAPKVRANQQGLLYEAHDYKTQGEIVDFVILMTYEWGWAGGKPLAISPVNSMRRVIDFAVTQIPRDKIVIGVSLYGRDWKIPWQSGTYARTISPQEAVRLAKRYKVGIQYNETYEAPFFFYTDQTGQKREVWFEDARSVQAKYDLVKEYRLRGVSYWDLTYPFPQNWAVLRSNFQTNKL
ncbi:glycosyl hydrolase family 18 protein [Aciduricibacillus chroicocephali]|uniref:glycosyl hydrolase family 18 protein n=1 Tax=Aciduricibacillus chroicocephali TaxID=3054939 RepID=UPI003267B842